MIYPFKCPTCNGYVEVVRAASDCSKPQVCECGTTMNRVWTAPQITPINFQDYYHEGLGKVVRTTKDIEGHIKRIKSETGTEYTMDKITPKKKKTGITLSDDEQRQIHQMLGEGD